MIDMKRTALTILSGIFILSVLLGCSANDKNSLADWLQHLDEEQLTVSFWSNGNEEKNLTEDEVQKVVSILNSLTEDNLTENKHLAGITPEFGFHLIAGGEDYYINQADAPMGQSEMGFHDKQWWIESSDFQDYMLSFVNSAEDGSF